MARSTTQERFAGALPAEGDEPVAEAVAAIDERLAVAAPVAAGDELAALGVSTERGHEPYYHPRVPGERFRVEGTMAFHRFQNGRYDPTTDAEEAAVRGALRAYGPDKADRWKGDDLDRPRICTKCQFATRNSRAFADHEGYRLHG